MQATMRATTKSGEAVEIIDWTTVSYLVRNTKTGATRWVPRDAMRPAQHGQKGGK